LIFVNIPWSWLGKPGSKKEIFEWSERYRDEFYEVAGIIELTSLNKTLYRWDEEAIGYTPKSDYWLVVFVRKG
jgi:hypothetical protein